MAATDRVAQQDVQIGRDPSVLGGEPFVRGTRISVRSVVLAAQEYGGTDGALRAYPHLSRRAVEEALDYYDRHREAIDRYIEENAADD
jgi:uncharacterized protein (DUF433 family)